jgi:hypothetical protein
MLGLRHAPAGPLETTPQHFARLRLVVHHQSQRFLALPCVAVQYRTEAIPVHGLGQVLRSAEGIAQIAVVGHRDQDHGDVGEAGIGLQLREHGPAVHVRHQDVEGDDVGAPLLGESQAFLAARGGEDPEAFAREEAAYQVQGGGVVVDHEHRRPGSRRRALGARLGVPLARLRRTLRQTDLEAGAAPELAGGRDGASQQLTEPLRDGQAQPGPPVLLERRSIRLAELVEDPCELLLVHTDSRVGDPEDEPILRALCRASRLQPDGPILRELAGVAQQVEQDLAQLGGVALHAAEALESGQLERVLVLADQGLDGALDAAHQLGHVELLDEDVHLSRLDLGQVEHAVDQLQQVAARAHDLAQVGSVGLVAIFPDLLLEHLAVADDGVQGRAQLVAHVGQELALGLVGRLGLAARALRLGQESGVLHGRGQRGDVALDRLDVLLAQLERLLCVGDEQRADHGVLDLEGTQQQPPHGVALVDRAVVWAQPGHRVGVDPGRVDVPALPHRHDGGAALFAHGDSRALEALRELRIELGPDHAIEKQPLAGRVEQEDTHLVEAEQLLEAVVHAGQHAVEVQRGVHHAGQLVQVRELGRALCDLALEAALRFRQRPVRLPGLEEHAPQARGGVPEGQRDEGHVDGRRDSRSPSCGELGQSRGRCQHIVVHVENRGAGADGRGDQDDAKQGASGRVRDAQDHGPEGEERAGRQEGSASGCGRQQAETPDGGRDQQQGMVDPAPPGQAVGVDDARQRDREGQAHDHQGDGAAVDHPLPEHEQAHADGDRTRPGQELAQEGGFGRQLRGAGPGHGVSRFRHSAWHYIRSVPPEGAAANSGEKSVRLPQLHSPPHAPCEARGPTTMFVTITLL